MKRVFFVLLTLVLFAFSPCVRAEINYDLSAFENNENLVVEFDDMDDTGIIYSTNDVMLSCLPTSPSPSGFRVVAGNIDIRIINTEPPVFRFNLGYRGSKPLSINTVIFKPAETRYTFEVESSSSTVGDVIEELFTIVLTDKSIGLIKDIIDENITSIRCRLAGKDQLDTNLSLSNLDGLKELYNAYVASGALKNDFSILNGYFPCTIK